MKLMPEIHATAGGDWVVGTASAYVPCPKNCGRMVAEIVNGVAYFVQPCSRCQKLALDRKLLVDSR